MDIYKDILLEPFTQADIECIAPMMQIAFEDDIIKHTKSKLDMVNIYNDGFYLRQFALQNKSEAFKICIDGQTVGLVIIWINKNEVNHISNFIIDINNQDKGIGLKVWRKLEAMYPSAKLWKVDLAGYSRKSHYFYVNKCGFKIVNISFPKNAEFCVYNLEKVIEYN